MSPCDGENPAVMALVLINNVRTVEGDPMLLSSAFIHGTAYLSIIRRSLNIPSGDSPYLKSMADIHPRET